MSFTGILLVLLLFQGLAGAEAAAEGAEVESRVQTVDSIRAEPSAEARPAADSSGTPPSRPTFQRPEHLRGIYLNAWASGSSRRRGALIDLARRTEINAFVLDIKDATGYVSHDTDVELAREVGADGEIRIRDLPGVLRQLEEEGIWPIARIVVIKDPLLTAARPELAIQDSTGGVWIDGKDQVWANPYNSRVWEYHVALAREVAEMGFPEIQWDYVRFPDAPRKELEQARYPGSGGRLRSQAIRQFLSYARESLSDLDVDMTADVFGVTTSFSHDVGIGQLWEDFIDVVDVALPMVYPSHYWTGSYGFDEPNAYPYEIVRNALEDAVRRSGAVEGAGRVRPWLQDFSLGEPAYGPAEVRAQIQAAYDVGIREWILWNPGSRYTRAALAPAGGFPDGWDPYIRVGGRLVPASKADEVYRTAAQDEPAEGDTTATGSDRDQESGTDGTRLRLGDGSLKISRSWERDAIANLDFGALNTP